MSCGISSSRIQRARTFLSTLPLLGFFTLTIALSVLADEPSPGAFESHADVGKVNPPGSVEFDKATQQYRVSSSGQNMWKDHDDFHFVYRKASGDVVLTAEVALVGEGHNAHRKAGLMIRQGLEPDAPYVDVMVHGDGLIALQYRAAKGGQTADVKSTIKAPAILRLERHGESFSLYLSAQAAKGEKAEKAAEFQLVGNVKVALADPVLIGLAVCSHDDNVTETAVFSNVSIKSEALKAAKKEGK